MDPLRAVLAVALPAVIAGALVLLVKHRVAGALAAGVGAAAGILAIFPFEKFFGSAAPCILLVAPLGAAVGAVAPGRARIALLPLLAAAPPLVALWFLPRETTPLGTKLAWGAGEAALVFAATLALDAWAGKREGFSVPIVVWVLAAGGAGGLAYNSYVSGAQVAGSVAATLGALAVLSWWRPREGAVRAAMPAASALLAATWLVGYHMNDYPLAPTALLLAAPLLVWAGELWKKRPTLLAGAAVLVPVLVALFLSRPEPSGE